MYAGSWLQPEWCCNISFGKSKSVTWPEIHPHPSNFKEGGNVKKASYMFWTLLCLDSGLLDSRQCKLSTHQLWYMLFQYASMIQVGFWQRGLSFASDSASPCREFSAVASSWKKISLWMVLLATACQSEISLAGWW